MLVKDQLQAVLANDTSMAMMFLIDIGSMQQAQILIFLKKKFFLLLCYCSIHVHCYWV